jgi:hypothetical protein
MEQPVEITQGDGAMKYEKCVEWLSQLSVVNVEFTGKYTLPEGSENMERFNSFISQFSGLVKEMALLEIASDSAACKLKEGGPKPNRFPRFAALSNGDTFSCRVNVTAVDRTDADVNVLHIDALQEDMRQAIMSGIYSNEKK